MNILLEQMAEDLGVYNYKGEEKNCWISRVLYSGLSCWIKTATLDTNSNNGAKGVSKKHVLLKCRPILEEFLCRYSGQELYFRNEQSEEEAISLLRGRLLAADEIKTIGFDSNIILGSKKERRLTDSIIRCYGEVLNEGAYYSGVAMFKNDIDSSFKEDPIQNSEEWFELFIKDLWWEKIDDVGEVEYFNPNKSVKNIYECWESHIPEDVKGIVLARRSINKYEYDYLLIRKGETVRYHRLDSLNYELQIHRKIAILFRAMVNNAVTSKAKVCDQFVLLSIFIKLPCFERLQLETYAWPVNRIDNEYEWVIPIELWGLIKKHIESLNIKVYLEGSHG